MEPDVLQAVVPVGHVHEVSADARARPLRVVKRFLLQSNVVTIRAEPDPALSGETIQSDFGRIDIRFRLLKRKLPHAQVCSLD